MKKQLLINILFSSIVGGLLGVFLGITKIEIPAWGLGVFFGVIGGIYQIIGNSNLKNK
ncbi:hypothetical protein [Tepidibacter sp. Z1-5]|uniref:hypothetical protein n=1 Tax=Tepidibacter sp. Z1-5 TaxID=3134138 RepID=UPI0030C27843